MSEREIFAQASEIHDARERGEFLKSACRGDAALQERIEALLTERENLGSYLEAPAAGRATLVQSPGPQTGTRIGPYKLLEQIGEGGMGLVYMAEQQEPVRRLVALKIIKPGMDSRQVIARFEAERQALAMMDHSSIAKVLDAGTIPSGIADCGLRIDNEASAANPKSEIQNRKSSGRPYFVMELVKGVPITKFCEERGLTINERLELFVPVCQAIQHAHQKGIIHRDIKPTNVLVALYDGVPVPKVIDFGVAKATAQPLTNKTMFTGFGHLIGTLEYMSPEQAQFNQLDIDTRSDIYSLGVVLYELLTGSTPLEQAPLQALAFDEKLRIIREEEPETVSARLAKTRRVGSAHLSSRHTPCAVPPSSPTPSLQTLVPRLTELDWIAMKALEKDRQQRYETASALAADLERYLHDEPVHACPPSQLYRFKKLLRRNRGTFAAVAGLLIGLTVAIGSIGWALRDRAARATETARAQSNRQALVQRQVRDSLDMARTLAAEGKLPSAGEKLAAAKAQLINVGLQGSLITEVETGQAELGQFQSFLDLIDRAQQAETEPLDASFAGAGPQGANLTPKTIWERRPEAAVPLLLQALASYSILDREDWRTALNGRFLATHQIEQIRRGSYEVLLWLADDAFRREQDHRSGQSLPRQSAAQAALVYLNKAETAYSPTHAFYMLRARCCKAIKDEARAEADTKRSDEIAPAIAFDHFLRGRAAYDAHQMTDAASAFEAALRVEPTHYWSMMNLGYCLADSGQPDGYLAAVRVFTGCILKRPDHAHAYHYRAYSYLNLQRYEEALLDYSKAIALDPKHPRAWHGRAEAYYKLRRDSEALADCDNAIEIDPKYSRAWFIKGLVHTKLDQIEEAIADYNRAIEVNPKNGAALTNLALLLTDSPTAKLRDPGRAVELATKATQLDPSQTIFWHALARARYRARDPQGALAAYDKALELAPRNSEARTGRASLYKILRQFDKAISDYEQVVEMSPNFHSTINNLAWLLVTCPDETLRQPQRAVELAEIAVSLSSQRPGYWNTLGIARYRAGDWQTAIPALEKSLELKSTTVAIDEFFLAMSYNKLERHDEARAAYAKALDWLDKNRLTIENNRALAKEIQQFQAEAEQVLKPQGRQAM